MEDFSEVRTGEITFKTAEVGILSKEGFQMIIEDMHICKQGLH